MGPPGDLNITYNIIITLGKMHSLFQTNDQAKELAGQKSFITWASDCSFRLISVQTSHQSTNRQENYFGVSPYIYTQSSERVTGCGVLLKSWEEQIQAGLISKVLWGGGWKQHIPGKSNHHHNDNSVLDKQGSESNNIENMIIPQNTRPISSSVPAAITEGKKSS